MREEGEKQKEINFFASPPFFPLSHSLSECPSEWVRAEAGEYYAAKRSQFRFFPFPRTQGLMGDCSKVEQLKGPVLFLRVVVSLLRDELCFSTLYKILS